MNAAGADARGEVDVRRLATGLAVSAVGLPTLLAFNLPPSSTFLNQAAALVGWGALLTVLAGSDRKSVV